MSVILMGMEMPENCGECRLMVDYWCYAKLANGQPGPTFMECRPDWCPLRPLPKNHGRLIDADAFIGTIRPIVEEDDYAGCTFRTVKELMTEHIDEAPTIVEAEGGDAE